MADRNGTGRVTGSNVKGTKEVAKTPPMYRGTINKNKTEKNDGKRQR